MMPARCLIAATLVATAAVAQPMNLNGWTLSQGPFPGPAAGTLLKATEKLIIRNAPNKKIHSAPKGSIVVVGDGAMVAGHIPVQLRIFDTADIVFGYVEYNRLVEANTADAENVPKFLCSVNRDARIFDDLRTMKKKYTVKSGSRVVPLHMGATLDLSPSYVYVQYKSAGNEFEEGWIDSTVLQCHSHMNETQILPPIPVPVPCTYPGSLFDLL